jgi:hypothetical protein
MTDAALYLHNSFLSQQRPCANPPHLSSLPAAESAGRFLQAPSTGFTAILQKHALAQQ